MNTAMIRPSCRFPIGPLLNGLKLSSLRDEKATTGVKWSLLVTCLVLGAADANQLRDHASPYLSLHGEDPVDWRDWDRSLLQQAELLDRPIFISSGYFTCHWCHVMQRESFQNPDIARLLNEHFIAVKLDRELHPAIDEHLIRFVARTAGHAGWPLNVFLTPEGYPLAGLTYAPAEEFAQILRQVADRWQAQGDHLRNLARTAAEALAEDRAQSAGSTPPSADILLSRLTAAALGQADELAGGFGQQSKFPQEPRLLALLEAFERRPDPELKAFLELTLEQMAQRGLRDHIGGGFFRYTVDPDWRTPHYEKMLYNQVQLIQVYLKASRILGRADFQQVARDTLDFVLRDMAGREGGFIAGLSALDAAGNEGASYLWRPAELAHNLDGDELELATLFWSLEPEAASIEGRLPQRLRSVETIAEVLQQPPDQVLQRVQILREKMLTLRASRAPPADSKQLAGWNGLMLSALAQAVAVTGDGRYAQAAATVAGYLRSRWDGAQLQRSRQAARALGEASLHDYAQVAQGLVDWAPLSSEQVVLQATARAIADAAWDLYFNEAGWRLAAVADLPHMVREAAMRDGALAAPSAVLLRVTQTLGLAPQRAKALNRALALSIPPVNEDPLSYASHALALLSVNRPANGPQTTE